MGEQFFAKDGEFVSGRQLSYMELDSRIKAMDATFERLQKHVDALGAHISQLNESSKIQKNEEQMTKKNEGGNKNVKND